MTNRLTSRIAAMLLAGASLAPLAAADTLAIILSPVGEPEAKKAEVISAVQLMTEAVEPSESATLFNGLTGQTICTFTVPDRSSYRSAKAKLNYNRSCVGKLFAMAKAADTSGTPGQLDLPGTLRGLATSLDMSAIDAVIISGSPIYDSPQEPSVSMPGAHVPSDGHIIVERTASPHSMAGLEGAFSGTPVHFTFQGYDWAINTRHEAAVHRFMALTFDTLGGPLVTFNADRDQLIERVKRSVNTPAETFERSPSTKLEMIQVRRDTGPRVPIHEREVTTTPLTDRERRRAEGLEVGITWDCACDLDIFVRAHDRAEVIYYGHPRTAEGQFWRDYRSGAELLNGLESVTFHAPVHLDEMVIGVNFYSGSAPEGVNGELRISVNGKTYAKPFVIEATSGNRGAGASEAFATLEAPNAGWVVMEGTHAVTGD